MIDLDFATILKQKIPAYSVNGKINLKYFYSILNTFLNVPSFSISIS